VRFTIRDRPSVETAARRVSSSAIKESLIPADFSDTGKSIDDLEGPSGRIRCIEKEEITATEEDIQQ
jgi:hypothetical protein